MAIKKLQNDIYRYLATFTMGVVFTVLLCRGEALSQDEPKNVEESSYQVISTTDPGISPTSLKIILRPLTAVELEAELSAWLRILQVKATELSQIELALADPDKKDEFQQNTNRAITIGEQRAELIQRIRIVIAAATVKGVDTKSADLYVKSLRSLPTAGGFTTLATLVRNWVISPQGGIQFAKALILFFVCIFVSMILGRIGSNALNRGLQRSGTTSDLLRSFLVHTVQRVALVVGVVIGLSYLGVNVGPMIAAIGGVGFVVGFALKDSLGNFAAGLMILFYRPFDVGNFIRTAGISGTVESLSLVSTILKTPDNQEVIVPNGKIWADVITNVTARNTRRVDLVFGIGYDDDSSKAQSILENVLNKHELILKDPEPVVKLNELADSSVNFVVRPWTKTSDYWQVYWDVTRQVKEAFDEAEISIPYPQQDVHVISGEKSLISE